jgi:hypothetical protein
MEIIDSIAWVTLGFLPMFGSMEVAWRLKKRRLERTIGKKKELMSVAIH